MARRHSPEAGGLGFNLAAVNEMRTAGGGLPEIGDQFC
jgi:hypothetical protein